MHPIDKCSHYTSTSSHPTKDDRCKASNAAQVSTFLFAVYCVRVLTLCSSPAAKLLQSAAVSHPMKLNSNVPVAPVSSVLWSTAAAFQPHQAIRSISSHTRSSYVRVLLALARVLYHAVAELKVRFSFVNLQHGIWFDFDLRLIRSSVRRRRLPLYLRMPCRGAGRSISSSALQKARCLPASSEKMFY